MRTYLAVILLWIVAALPLCAAFGDDDTLQVPAGTAYFQPDIEPAGTDVSAEGGVTGWADAKDSVVWYGHLGAGRLGLGLTLRLPAGAGSSLRLTIGKQSRTANAVGGDALSTVSFGDVTIPKADEYRLALSGMSKTGAVFGDIQTLTLTGPAVKDAHFSQARTRGAPSVHLFYKTPKDAPITWFYNEVTAKADPIDSYYMACGFSRGYFGIQVNSPTERRIIFSVWDSGKEPTDRTKVAADDLVQLIGKGPGVYTSGFGNEGTGGHSHLVYPWKTGQTYRLLVSAQPDGTGTIYSGYFYFPERKAWGLIASFRAPKDGQTLRGLYSFNEDFNGANGFAQRRAEFGPAWIRTADGKWTAVTQATFSHTADGKSERLDRSGGTLGDRFYLSNGGFTPASDVKYGDLFTRPASGHPPTDAELPTPPHAIPTGGA
jgi:hypothetical protein